ncbi:MAG: lipid A deacylase LpxR family protein [Deltaproteobacteria bacterium]|nr:MAG: lipid A deacylase LpxR family protein [Deltaproteobacteria bacterium]
MRTLCLLCLWLAYLGLMCTVPSHAVPSSSSVTKTSTSRTTAGLLPRQVSFQVENDFFLGSDRDYSSGLFVRVANWGALGQAALGLTKLMFPGSKPTTHLSSFEILVGQEMYTPLITDRADFVPYERPFAGWLYTGVRYRVRAPVWSLSLELRLGLVGPYSFASHLMQFWHELIKLTSEVTSASRGWAWQLEHEFTVQAIASWDWHILRVLRHQRKHLDLSLRTTLAVGNVWVHPEVKLLWNFGWLPQRVNDNASFTFHTGTTSGKVATKAPPLPRRHWDVYFFFHPFARVVIRNMFVDGLTFIPSPRTERYPGIVGFEAGLDWRVRWFRMRVAAVIHTLDGAYALRDHTNHRYMGITLFHQL